MQLLKTVEIKPEPADCADVDAMIAHLQEPIESFTRRYPVRRSAIMPALSHAQAEYGHLSREVMQAVAYILDMSPVQVYEIATFYSMYHTKPVGKFHLQVCSNVSCMLLGAEHLLSYIEQQLNLKVGEVSADGIFSLCEVECLGSCHTAPMMQVNNAPYNENLNEQRIDNILQELRKQQTITD